MLGPEGIAGRRMKYLPLVWAGLWRRPARTIFTFLSISVAFILFGILAAFSGGMAQALEASRLDRLFVDTKFGTNLPYAYVERVAAVPGVTVVAPRQIVVGYYRDPKQPMGIVMSDRRFFAVRPELNATPEQIDALMRTRTGALITVFAAKQFGWKVGDKVPIISNTLRKDAGKVWTFDILGIIDNVDQPGRSRFFIGNYDYVDQERVASKGTVDRMLVRIQDPARATQISRAIDKLFANSAAPTRTTSEKSAAQSGAQSLGDIGFFIRAVIVAVLFMLLFLTGNTMMQSVRERVPEFAVLKAMGYPDSRLLWLVYAEAVILCLLAALAGLAVAKLVIPRVRDIAPQTGQMLLMPWSAIFTGLCFALAVAFIAGLLPALRARRLSIIDALAGR
jgi:putative ABC transport system permease protein